MNETRALDVLLVEDNPGESWLFSKLLEARGHRVDAHGDGESALESFRSGTFDLVVLDLMLPGIDGIEVCRIMRSEPRGEVPVVLVVTAADDPEVFQAVLEAGADDYVAKPADVAILDVRIAVAEQAVAMRRERARARAELESRTRELSTLFASLPDLYFSVDVPGDRLIQVSPASNRFFGVSPDRLRDPGSRWKELLFPDGLDTVADELLHLPEGESLIRLHEARRADGSPVSLETTLAPQVVAGSLRRIDGVISDVTARRKAQQDLGARNQELATLFRVSEIAMRSESLAEAAEPMLGQISRATGFPVVWIDEHDADRDMLTIVQAQGLSAGTLPIRVPVSETVSARTLSNGRPVAIVDPGFREQTHPVFRDQGLRTLVAVPLLAGAHATGTLTLCHSEAVSVDDRTLQWLENVAHTVSGFLERIRTAAELRASESGYRDLAEELRSANRELEGFAYSVAHDLRAPLRTMTGFAHALVENLGDELPETAHDFVGRIITSGHRAENLITDLLTYSRLRLEAIELQDVDLDDVLESVTEQLRGDIEARGAQVEIEGPMPTVRGVLPILVQVFSNLVSNGVKFVPEDRTPHIRIRAELAERAIRIRVVDNGPGVPEGQEERIFHVFERLADTNPDVPGTGIGLALVRRGMERMGGSAGVERLEEGSAFWVTIPGV